MLSNNIIDHSFFEVYISKVLKVYYLSLQILPVFRPFSTLVGGDSWKSWRFFSLLALIQTHLVEKTMTRLFTKPPFMETKRLATIEQVRDEQRCVLDDVFSLRGCVEEEGNRGSGRREL